MPIRTNTGGAHRSIPRSLHIFFLSSLTINSNKRLLMLHIPALPLPVSFPLWCLFKPKVVTAHSANVPMAAEGMWHSPFNNKDSPLPKQRWRTGKKVIFYFWWILILTLGGGGQYCEEEVCFTGWTLMFYSSSVKHKPLAFAQLSVEGDRSHSPKKKKKDVLVSQRGVI